MLVQYKDVVSAISSSSFASKAESNKGEDVLEFNPEDDDVLEFNPED